MASKNVSPVYLARDIHTRLKLLSVKSQTSLQHVVNLAAVYFLAQDEESILEELRASWTLEVAEAEAGERSKRDDPASAPDTEAADLTAIQEAKRLRGRAAWEELWSDVRNPDGSHRYPLPRKLMTTRELAELDEVEAATLVDPG